MSDNDLHGMEKEHCQKAFRFCQSLLLCVIIRETLQADYKALRQILPRLPGDQDKRQESFLLMHIS